MKKITKEKIKKDVRIMMAVLMMLIMLPLDAQAATGEETERNTEIVQLTMVSGDNDKEADRENSNARATLYNCIMSVYCSESGMEIAFSTDCSRPSTTIGVKDIVIKQRVWYGWKTVATSIGGFYTNESTYSGTILYTNAILGEEYRITCTHYADADEYVEVHGELDLVFTY